MNWRDLYDIAVALGLPGIWLWYVRDRRRSKASSRVAEGTVGADIAKGEIGAFDVHVAYIERAFAAERQSMQRQISGLTNEVNDLRGQVQGQREEIEALRGQLSRIDNERGRA